MRCYMNVCFYISSMSPLCPKAADRLLACSIPAGYWGEEVKRKLKGKAKGRKGNGEKGKKGKGREEEWKGKEEFCAVVIFP